MIAIDNRGHGASGKLYDRALYEPRLMAGDALALLDHLGLRRADVMGYSMGGRIGAYAALAAPERVRSLILGGIGINLVEGVGLPVTIAEALLAPSLDDVTDPTGRMFRAFAEQTRSDRQALAACIYGTRQQLDARGGGAHRGADAHCCRHQRRDRRRRPQARGTDTVGASGRYLRTATTCSRSATRCSSRRCWSFWKSGRERYGVLEKMNQERQKILV